MQAIAPVHQKTKGKPLVNTNLPCIINSITYPNAIDKYHEQKH